MLDAGTCYPDGLGNHHADALATDGAKLHAVPERTIRLARTRMLLTKSVQQLMVETIKARNSSRLSNEDKTLDLEDHAIANEVVEVSDSDDSDLEVLE